MVGVIADAKKASANYDMRTKQKTGLHLKIRKMQSCVINLYVYKK